MREERRGGCFQPIDDLVARLTDRQKQAFFEKLQPYGWRLFAIRQRETKPAYLLIQGPRGQIRHLRKDGVVSFKSRFRVRKSRERRHEIAEAPKESLVKWLFGLEPRVRWQTGLPAGGWKR